MSDKKDLWNQQRAERERLKKELQTKIIKLKEESTQKEVEIEIDTRNQIKAEQQMSKNDYEYKIKQELDLFKEKEREIEDKYRTQEMIEKNKLIEEFEMRVNKIVIDEKSKCKDIEDRNNLKARHLFTDNRINFHKELDSVIDSMNKQIVDLEEKLIARERDLLDSDYKDVKTSTQISQKTRQTLPKQETEQQIIKLKSPLEEEKPTEFIKNLGYSEYTKPKTDKKPEKKEIKKVDKKVEKKPEKKDDKKKPKNPNRPWDDMTKFN